MLEIVPHATDADERVALDIYNTVWPHDPLTMEDVLAFRSSVRAYVYYLARVDGVPVGSGIGVIFPQRDYRVFLILSVLGGHRGQGAGTGLYQAISAWTSERGLSEIEVPIRDNDSESLAFAGKRGFTQERHEFGVVLRLAESHRQQAAPPEGIEVVTWARRPGLARGMYEVVLEAEPDIPGLEDIEVGPFDDWLEHSMQGPGDNPEATFIALAGDDVVGFAKLGTTQAQPTIAHHSMSAVKRAWRGRGIARALKSAQINWALDHGYTELRTANEERNEPIRRLNARLGYRPAVGRVYVVGPLAR